ncbi:hypothetical protein PILCRDRAFT_816999 [Piloderma croceum F 1598]|uniref:Uncharacterized protein n=1 Tax=Piloderma croceum (strain F 1598) TaxID=765440 RepID=A0A0C3FPA3_PILCF|nr:hypothetical protein PILCRDRAFT_816999 [Piloderma croceum F 1598]
MKTKFGMVPSHMRALKVISHSKPGTNRAAQTKQCSRESPKSPPKNLVGCTVGGCPSYPDIYSGWTEGFHPIQYYWRRQA